MKARDVLKLQTGDIITCLECPWSGCDGQEVKVTVIKHPCGCVDYFHSNNDYAFFFDNRQCNGAVLHRNGWAYTVGDLFARIIGESIKLVRRKEEQRMNKEEVFVYIAVTKEEGGIEANLKFSGERVLKGVTPVGLVEELVKVVEEYSDES